MHGLFMIKTVKLKHCEEYAFFVSIIQLKMVAVLSNVTMLYHTEKSLPFLNIILPQSRMHAGIHRVQQYIYGKGDTCSFQGRVQYTFKVTGRKSMQVIVILFLNLCVGGGPPQGRDPLIIDRKVQNICVRWHTFKILLSLAKFQTINKFVIRQSRSLLFFGKFHSGQKHILGEELVATPASLHGEKI